MNPILVAQQNDMRDINDMPNAPDPADGTDMVDATDTPDSSPKDTAPAFTENGTMQIQVVSAFTAIPISGASVTIRESRKENLTDTGEESETNGNSSFGDDIL